MGGVLITGGAGYIGSCFAWSCHDAGVPFAVVDDLSTGDRRALPPGAAFVQAKVSDTGAVSACIREHGLDSVAHFAGSISIEESVRDPEKYQRNNVLESRALLDTIEALGIGKVVFSSTAAIYGDPGGDPISETTLPAPTSPYGQTKVAVEKMLQAREAAGALRFITLRYFNVAGADPGLRTGARSGGAGNLIKTCCEVALGRKPRLVVHGDDYLTADGSCVRDYIHVADLAQAHLAAAAHLAAGGGSAVLNCGYGRGFSVREVIRAFEVVTGKPMPVDVGPRRAGDVAQVISNARLIRQTLDWTPRHQDLNEMVKSALDWEATLGQAPAGMTTETKEPG